MKIPNMKFILNNYNNKADLKHLWRHSGKGVLQKIYSYYVITNRTSLKINRKTEIQIDFIK